MVFWSDDMAVDFIPKNLLNRLNLLNLMNLWNL